MNMTEKIEEIIESNEYELVGWRLIDGDVNTGDMLENSKIWIGDAPTKNNADGVSAFSELRDMLKYAQYSSRGFTLALIGGERGRIFDDQEVIAGEIIIRNATVLATYRRENMDCEWVEK